MKREFAFLLVLLLGCSGEKKEENLLRFTAGYYLGEIDDVLEDACSVKGVSLVAQDQEMEMDVKGEKWQEGELIENGEWLEVEPDFSYLSFEMDFEGEREGNGFSLAGETDLRWNMGGIDCVTTISGNMEGTLTYDNEFDYVASLTYEATSGTQCDLLPGTYLAELPCTLSFTGDASYWD